MRLDRRAILLGAVAACTVLGVTLSSRASDDKAKERKVRELLEMTGASNIGQRVLDKLLDGLRKQPDVPPGFEDEVREMAGLDRLVERIVKAYMEQLDEGTLDAAIAFYRTPPGQKLLRAELTIGPEVLRLTEGWAKKLTHEVLVWRRYRLARADDMDRLTGLVGLLITGGAGAIAVTKSGHIDLFRFAQNGKVHPSDWSIYRSARLGKGSTDEEVRAGDYANFPYDRYRGTAKCGPESRVPLLWDKAPDLGGGRLVGLGNGSVRYFKEAEFQALLKEHRQGE